MNDNESNTCYRIDTRSDDAMRALELSQRNERSLAEYRCRVMALRASVPPVEVSEARIKGAK